MKLFALLAILLTVQLCAPAPAQKKQGVTKKATTAPAAHAPAPAPRALAGNLIAALNVR